MPRSLPAACTPSWGTDPHFAGETARSAACIGERGRENFYKCLSKWAGAQCHIERAMQEGVKSSCLSADLLSLERNRQNQEHSHVQPRCGWGILRRKRGICGARRPQHGKRPAHPYPTAHHAEQCVMHCAWGHICTYPARTLGWCQCARPR